MEDEWLEDSDPPMSDDLLKAVGRLALAFAALENCLAQVLCRGTGEDGPSIEDLQKQCDKRLSTLIKEFELQSGHQNAKVIAEKIRTLADTRNTLMHGMHWHFMSKDKEAYLSLLSLQSKKNLSQTIVRVSDINRMAHDVRGIVFSLGYTPSWKPN